jgi:type I restriction enzyme S subunit
MTGGLKPYPAMKDSGVAWLGEVPEHWKVQRLRNLTGMRVSNVDKHTKDDEQPVRLCNYVDVYKNDYIRPSMRLMRATATKDEIERFRLAEGDVLITKDSEAWNDIGVPALVRESADDLVSGYHLALLRPFRGRIIGEFLFRSLQSAGVQYQFHVEANGVTRYGLSHAAIKSVWLPAPPLPEQAAIVRFLDHADRRIRRYIRVKQKLIKLLEEQKQAIIHRAVTRGLDPSVRLKPSGVEWLGDVPEHWEVSRVKNEFFCLNRRRVPLSATERGAMTLRRYDYYGASGVIDKVDEYLFDDELLLVAEDGANLVLRNLPLAIIARGKFWVNNHAHILKPRRGNLEYLAAVMERINYQPWISGAAQPKLTQERLMVIAIAVAPPEEQEQIVKAQNEQTAPLRATIGRARREIDLLREYRTRLIADVVTGKLDVREAAARLPQEAEDLEPLEESEALGEMEDESAADDLEAESQEAEA